MGQGRPFENGSDYWRLIEPFLMAREHGHLCFVQPRGKAVRVPPDIVMMRGEFWTSDRDFDRMLLDFERDKALYVLDYDDSYHEWAQDHALVNQGKSAPPESVRHQTERAHVVTTTTVQLAQEICYLTGRTDVHVIPNYINLGAWRFLQPPKQNRPIVTVMGGDSHGDDWRDIIPYVFRGIAAGNPDVTFRLWAHNWEWAYDLAHELAGRVELVSFVPHSLYPRKIEGSTVVLAPLADTLFNRGKTPIRHWEATAAGACFIGSPILYHQSVIDGETGHLTDDPDEYVGLTLDLLADPNRRMLMVSYAREQVLSHMLTKEVADDRFNLYYQEWHRRYGAEVPHGTSATVLLPQTDPRVTDGLWTPEGRRVARLPDARYRELLSRDRPQGGLVG